MPKRPVRFFNTTGPCNPDDHYMLPPAERLRGAQLHRYVRDNLYWMLHAPRQTGKTTFLQSWMRELNATGQVIACYVSVERCQAFPDAARAIPALCSAIREFANAVDLPAPPLPDSAPEIMLGAMLADWAALVAPKPLVVLCLEDPRVRHVMEMLMSGIPDPNLAGTDGFDLCLDLGLVIIEDGVPQVANPIYREVLAREMTWSTQLAIAKPAFRWQTPRRRSRHGRPPARIPEILASQRRHLGGEIQLYRSLPSPAPDGLSPARHQWRCAHRARICRRARTS
ncbi:MAG: ATP-binding protein [Opitutaceae bacterium]|nr:ATP-binding protein [Opitutaceae bacterium]